jgi:hypothetical protein
MVCCIAECNIQLSNIIAKFQFVLTVPDKSTADDCNALKYHGAIDVEFS